MKKIIIIGAGGNSKVIIDLMHSRIRSGEELQILGFLDDDKDKTELMGYLSLGPVENIEKYHGAPDIYFVNGIGDNKIRKKVFEKY
ncbi:MAG TPA: transferase, partial [Syntrophomonas sp.]|nr:transferase [Syntrophomonas sp.]